MTKRTESCPLCAAVLARSLAYGPSVGDTGNGSRPSRHEERDCPSCGAQLHRTGDGPWLPMSKPDSGEQE
ncbi:MAG: hypothetical protein WD602_00165 [Actinomycetota bacterium]